jgi:hypothetical protein
MKSLDATQRNPPPVEPAEGVIQFRFELTAATAADRLNHGAFAHLVAWRRILRQLKLIGRDARRYDGYGYGNLSARDPVAPTRFYVTASQTGGTARIGHKHIVRVDHWNAARFDVAATGAAAPSSESITHGMLYAADAGIMWIMHVHSRDIWQAASRLKLPATDAAVAYGSPAMAAAVEELMQRHAERPLLFATLGHADGIFACGGDAATVGSAIVTTLARALQGAPR